MPRSIFAGAKTLFTSMKQPLSRTMPSSLGWPSWMYSLWLTATMSAVEVHVLLERGSA